MHARLIISAVVSAFATTVSAAPIEAPYALSAVHADFQLQLDRAAEGPGAVGAAARAAAGLLAPHNAAQERLVLPVLGLADAATGGWMPADPHWPDLLQSLEAELARLHDSDVELVTALVGLYAAAEEAGQPDVSRLAQQMIWHEVSDIQVLYPAALLVGSAVRGQMSGAAPVSFQGSGPVPGAGTPHAPATRN